MKHTEPVNAKDKVRETLTYPATCPLVFDGLPGLLLPLTHKVSSMLHIMLYDINQFTLEKERERDRERERERERRGEGRREGKREEGGSSTERN